MWATAVKLALSVLGFFFERFKKRAEDTPENKRDEIDQAINDGDEGQVNKLLDDAVSGDGVRPADKNPRPSDPC